MNKKSGQHEEDFPGKESATAPPDTSGIEEYDVTEAEYHNQASLSGRVWAFLQRVEVEGISPIYYLSKYDNYGTGESKAFVAKFEDCEPPDEDLIGTKYGPGRYVLTCQIPVKGQKNPLVRIYKFRVSQSFARQGDRSGPAAIPAAIPAAVVNPQEGMIQAFSMLERFVGLLLPLFNRPRDENVLGILNQNYSAVNELMKKQMQDNLKMINDYQRTIAEIGGGEGGEVEPATGTERAETPSIVEQFAPLIQQWLPLLIGNGPKAAAAGAIVQSVPQVQDIIKDKLQLRKIVAYLDQSQGPDKTDKVLAALKITRPGKRPVAVQVQQEPKGRKRPAAAG